MLTRQCLRCHNCSGEPPSNSGIPCSVYRAAQPNILRLLLQQLMEDVTGQPFADLLQQTVFDSRDATQHLHYPLPKSHALRPVVMTMLTPRAKNGLVVFVGGWGLWSTPTTWHALIELQQSASGHANQVLSPAMSVIRRKKSTTFVRSAYF